MSRAFTKENDGWAFCILKHESCMFADENGTCSLDTCQKDANTSKKSKEKITEKTYQPIRFRLD